MNAAELPTILFDQDCPFCRLLGEYSRRRNKETLRVISWQEYLQSDEAKEKLDPDFLSKPADKLRVLTPDELIENDIAWQWLIKHHPDLKALGWIAEKLGLTKSTAKIIAGGGHLLRRLICKRCPHERPFP